MNESQRLTEVVVLNFNKSSKSCVHQITKDDSTKSALSRLTLNQVALFNFLTAKKFKIDRTPELNTFSPAWELLSLIIKGITSRMRTKSPLTTFVQCSDIKHSTRTPSRGTQRSNYLYQAGSKTGPSN
jgi:hypothetical protein